MDTTRTAREKPLNNIRRSRVRDRADTSGTFILQVSDLPVDALEPGKLPQQALVQLH